MEKKTNNGRTIWIIQRNGKKISFFKNKQKKNDLKLFQRTLKNDSFSTERTNFPSKRTNNI